MPAPDAIGSGIGFDPPTMPPCNGDYFDVIVSHVISPGYFIIQLVETTSALSELMDEMEVAYSRAEAKVYR